MNNVWTFTGLTFREAYRKKFFWLAVGLGAAFLIFFTIGLNFIVAEIEAEYVARAGRTPLNILLSQVSGGLLLAGLFAINFLVVMMTGLISVGTISGEIDSHIIQTLATKPQPRWQLVFGKWLGLGLMLALYVLFMVGGLTLCVYFVTGYWPPNFLGGLSLLILEGVVVLSLAMFGSTFLSTQANGVMVFMLYGMAFVGGWVEQIGSALESEVAVQFGVVASLIMPSDALWRMVSIWMQPVLAARLGQAGGASVNPFSPLSEPSNAMIVYAILYVLVMLAGALYQFSRRDL